MTKLNRLKFPRVDKKLTPGCLLLVACLGILTAAPTNAASLQRVNANWGTNHITTSVVMDIYVPDTVVTNPPIVVCLHHCGGWGALSFNENSDLVAAADQYGFIIIFPSALNSDGSYGRCWDNNSTQALTRYGGGDSEAVAQMVNYTVTNYQANVNRVTAQGGSSGAMMTETMLAVYPDIFKAGVGFAGVTAGTSGWDAHVKHSPQEWGNIVRAMFPGYTGRRPRIQLWHGTADPIVAYSNIVESTKQYSNLLGLSPTPSLTVTQMLFSITNAFVHQVWQNPCGDVLIDAWSEIGGDHGSGAWKAVMYLSFLGLDVVGPVDPLMPCVVVPANSRIEAENFHAASSGIQIESCSEGGQNITNLQNGSYIVFENVDFGVGAANFQARVASAGNGGSIALHLDALNGVQVGTCVVTNTGGWQNWATQSCPVGGAAGVHDLYLKFTGGSGPLFNLNWLQFNSVFNVDVGTVGYMGGASYGNGVFTVTGSGDDIWNTADAFHFVYVPVTGNCVITARVLSIQNTDPWAKAGVMIRESTNANSANAFIAVTSSNGVTFQYRSTTGGNSSFNNTTGLSAPYWVRLVRSGNTFTAYRSPNGVNWTQQGSPQTFAISSTAYAGLALTSHNNSSLCMATFDNVAAPGWLTPLPPAPAGLAATAASANEINLAWSASAGATAYNINRSTHSGGPYTNISTGVATTNFTDTVASVGSGYYYVVSAVIGGSETPNSAEAAVRFPKLPGGIIGTAGSYNNSGNTIAKVFDNDLNTFFDGPNNSSGNGCWAGLDFGVGVSNAITQIKYCPRAGFESRMVGGVFQGANLTNFAGAVTLYGVGTQPFANVFTIANISNTTAFRFVRYLSPNGGWGNVAEVEFYGYPRSPSTAVPPSPAMQVLNGNQIVLTWNWGTLVQATNLLGPWMAVQATSPYTNIQVGRQQFFRVRNP